MSALRTRFGLAGLGLLSLTIAVVVMAFWYLGYAQKLFEGTGRQYKAEFANAQQLAEGDLVRVDGRKEGRVRKIEDRDGGRTALVTFDVKDDAGPIYRDAHIGLRWRTLLGGAFYLTVDRGTPSAGDLPEGATVPKANNDEQVEIEDVTSVFQGGAKKGLATLPGELARGFSDPDALPRLLDTAAATSPNLTQALSALRGKQADTDLRALMQGTADTVSALDAPRDELRALVSGAAGTLLTTGDRADDIRSTLALGGGASDSIDVTMKRLSTTLDGADTLVGKLRRSAADVAPTLRDLRPTLGSTDRLLSRATPLVRALKPTLRSVARLGSNGVPLIDALQPSLDRLDDTILPYLARKDPGTGKPTSVMIGGTAAGFGGSAGQRDENGHFIRFPATVGASSVYLPCRTALTDPTAKELAVCDDLQTAAQNYLQYVPGLTGSPAATKGKG